MGDKILKTFKKILLTIILIVTSAISVGTSVLDQITRGGLDGELFQTYLLCLCTMCDVTRVAPGPRLSGLQLAKVGAK